MLTIKRHNELVNDVTKVIIDRFQAEIQKLHQENENLKEMLERVKQERDLKEESMQYFLKKYNQEQCLKLVAESENRETLSWAIFDIETKEDIYSRKNKDKFENEKREVDKYFCDLKNSQLRALDELNTKLSSKILALENENAALRRSNEKKPLENFKMAVKSDVVVEQIKARISDMKQSLLGQAITNSIKNRVCCEKPTRSLLDYDMVELKQNVTRTLNLCQSKEHISETEDSYEVDHPFIFGSENPYYFKGCKEKTVPAFQFV